MTAHSSRRPDVAEILSHIEMPTLVERFSGPGRQQGSRWVFPCPNPRHNDRRPSFDVAYTGGKWWGSCRSEDVHVDAVDLLVWIGAAHNRGESIRQLADFAGLGDGTMAPVAPRPPVQPRPATAKLDTNSQRPDDHEQILERFMARRGWTSQVVDLFGLSVISDPTGRPRVRFPWWDHAGRLVFYQDRAAWDDAPKEARWRAPRGISAPFPFGMHRLAVLDEPAGQSNVFIVEGPSDAVSLTDARPDTVVIGIPGGNTPRLRWERALEGLDLFLIADADPSGDRYRSEWHERLGPHANRIHHVYVPPQWGDLDGWRRAVGEGFGAEFIDAVKAVIATQDGAP